MGRVDECGGGSNSVGESSIGSGIGVSSIASVQESRVSISITLAIVVSVVSTEVRSISLGGGIKSLGDWVKTSAGAEWDTGVVSTIEKSGVSFSLSLTLANIVGISGSAGDGDIGSVHTGSRLESYTIAKSIGVASIASVEEGGVSLG